MSDANDALIVLRNAAGDVARISPHGAQLLSWQPAGAPEQIYLSPMSRPGPGVAVRGGAPICFPQFSERGPLPKHGFARTRRWVLVAPPSPSAPAEKWICFPAAAHRSGCLKSWPSNPLRFPFKRETCCSSPRTACSTLLHNPTGGSGANAA